MEAWQVAPNRGTDCHLSLHINVVYANVASCKCCFAQMSLNHLFSLHIPHDVNFSPKVASTANFSKALKDIFVFSLPLPNPEGLILFCTIGFFRE
jgi:hypothetical protein